MSKYAGTNLSELCGSQAVKKSFDVFRQRRTYIEMPACDWMGKHESAGMQRLAFDEIEYLPVRLPASV